MKHIINKVILLCLTVLLPQIALAQFTGDSWSDFPDGAKAVCDNELDTDTTNDDIDDDNDGLIELCYLDDVAAMRHDSFGFSLRRKDASAIRTGCGGRFCRGYELVRDLDFNDDDSYITTANKVIWTTGTGWPTILTDGFFATLEGNGHTISNLFVNKSVSSFSRNLGFMGDLGSSYHIRNLGLSNINFAVTVNNAFGVNARGVLLGQNNGTVTNCYVQGRTRI